jgi:hypothetical protein
MKVLKEKNVNELLKNVDDIIYFLYTHNKNYTKKQYENILNLIDIIEELKERI